RRNQATLAQMSSQVVLTPAFVRYRAGQSGGYDDQRMPLAARHSKEGKVPTDRISEDFNQGCEIEQWRYRGGALNRVDFVAKTKATVCTTGIPAKLLHDVLILRQSDVK